MVVGGDALAAAGGNHGLAPGTNGYGEGPGSGEGGFHSLVLDEVEAVGDDDGDGAGSDGGWQTLGFAAKVKLGEAFDFAVVVGGGGFGRLWGAGLLGDGLGEVERDVAETLSHVVVDDGVVAVVKFEGEGGGKVGFLNVGEGVVEQLWLLEVLGELGRVHTFLHSYNLLREVDVAALGGFGGREDGGAVGPIVELPFLDGVPFLTITVVVHDGADGPVNGDLLPVYAEARELSVEIGEVAALKKRVVGEADTWNKMGSAEGYLLCLSEELVDISVEFQFSNVSDGEEIFGPDFSSI